MKPFAVLTLLIVAVVFGGCRGRENAIGLRNTKEAIAATREAVVDGLVQHRDATNAVVADIDAGAPPERVRLGVARLQEHWMLPERVSDAALRGSIPTLSASIDRFDPKGETAPTITKDQWLADPGAAAQAGVEQGRRAGEENDAVSAWKDLPWDVGGQILGMFGLGGLAAWIERRRRQAAALAERLRTGLSTAVRYGEDVAQVASAIPGGERLVKAAKDKATELQEMLGIRELVRYEVRQARAQRATAAPTSREEPAVSAA